MDKLIIKEFEPDMGEVKGRVWDYIDEIFYGNEKDHARLERAIGSEAVKNLKFIVQFAKKEMTNENLEAEAEQIKLRKQYAKMKSTEEKACYMRFA
jgi:hypothetical protein